MTDHDVTPARRRAGAVLLAAGSVLLAAGVASLLGGWVNWPAVLRWLDAHAMPVALAVGGIAALVVAGVLRRGRGSAGGRRRAPLSWWAIAIGATLVLTVTWTATEWLLNQADQAKDPAAARVEAVKTGLGIGAGTGGVLALLLAVRRQWHQEVTALDTTHDATERRVTELYTKAAEQLGSDKAPVRLAGLYALERLAQKNPDQRQTIVNVWCAYLRMPFAPPADQPPGIDPATEEGKQELVEYREAVQEKEVRLTAQRLLTDHLRPGSVRKKPAATFWADINLDLTGAHLINLRLRGCTVRTSDFTRATFAGYVDFENAAFTGYADFRNTTFTGDAYFKNATFTGSAEFHEAIFTGSANFQKAAFRAVVSFTGATFAGYADFKTAVFHDSAIFDRVNFSSRVQLTDTTFFMDARFLKAAFTDRVNFTNTVFFGTVNFQSSTFIGRADFAYVRFRDLADFTEAKFTDRADFMGVTFMDFTTFQDVVFAIKVPAEVKPWIAPDTDAASDASPPPHQS